MVLSSLRVKPSSGAESAGHMTHWASASALHGTLAAGTQCLEDGENGHGRSTVTFGEVQSVHGVQNVDPGCDAYVPLGHGWHDAENEDASSWVVVEFLYVPVPITWTNKGKHQSN